MLQLLKDKVKALEKTNYLITEHLVDAVWIVDAKTLKYDYITPSIKNVSGFSTNELIGTTVFERLLPETSEEATTKLIEAVWKLKKDKQQVQSLEIELEHKRGYSYWVEIRAKLIETINEPPKIVGITRDITLRKKTQLALEKANQELREALAEKDRLSIEVKRLEKLLPICSGCRRIRDENDKWWPIEEYIRSHTDSEFTHTICPECRGIYYSI